MQIRPDNVVLTTLLDTYLNYDTQTALLSISGTIPIGTTNFSTTFSVARSDSIADVYARNLNTGNKMSLTAGSIHNPYQEVSTETHPCSVTYSGSVLTVQYNIDNNTGAPLALTAQTHEITVVLNEVPY